MSGSTISQGFAFDRAQFQQIIDDTLAIAKALGATDAAAEVSEGAGLSVSVRKGEIENVERNRDKSVGITVYAGQRRGNASTSDFSRAALRRRCLRHRPPHQQQRGRRHLGPTSAFLGR